MHSVRRLFFWLSWPALFLYFKGSKRARALLIDGDQVLLVKGRESLWYGDSKWGLPGGGMRSNETPVTAAQRELSEELGIMVKAEELKALSDGIVMEYGLTYHAYFLVAHLPSSIALKLQKTELAIAEWQKIDSLDPRMLGPEVRIALQAWSDKSALLQ